MGKLHFVGSPDSDLTPGNAIARGMFRASFAGRFYPDLAAVGLLTRRLDRPVRDRGAGKPSKPGCAGSKEISTSAIETLKGLRPIATIQLSCCSKATDSELERV
jgi:hypothetical protein